jgi:hypothetical protein
MREIMTEYDLRCESGEVPLSVSGPRKSPKAPQTLPNSSDSAANIAQRRSHR